MIGIGIRIHVNNMSIEVLTFPFPKGKEYVRDMYDSLGNWVGIEVSTFRTPEEAKKRGYVDLQPNHAINKGNGNS